MALHSYAYAGEGIDVINKKVLLNRITAGSALADNKFTGSPLIEVTGDHRVLIENHCGVREYSSEKISVNVNYGIISISGEKLTLAQMTQEQLVICGRILDISLIRRIAK